MFITITLISIIILPYCESLFKKIDIKFAKKVSACHIINNLIELTKETNAKKVNNINTTITQKLIFQLRK